MNNEINKLNFITKILLTCVRRVLPLALLLMMLPLQQAYAADRAGKVIYTHGKVWVLGSDGESRVVKKGDAIYSGDTVVTNAGAMTHMRMADKGYISLRSNSQFKIEQFKLGKNKDEDKGFFALLKGGFRAVTGIIGKRKRSSYRVRTTIATIGIRGTDYTARICNDDCGSAVGAAGERAATIENGLYVGVLDGGVALSNQLGELELQRLHYGFVKDAASAPRALLNAPKFLFFKTRSPRVRDDDEKQSTETKASTLAGRSQLQPVSDDALSSARQNSDIGEATGDFSQNDIESQTSFEQETVDGVDLNNPVEQAGQVIAMASGPLGTDNSFSDVHNNGAATLIFDSNGFVEGFSAGSPSGAVVKYSIGSAQNLDLGLDENTGIRWGRWADGTAKVADEDLNLNNSSLHWVTGPSTLENVTLPTSGSISYNLVGNTSPTDNLGNQGILGSASLNANFSNMTANTSVNVGINNQVWSGSTTTGMPITANGQYSGAMDVGVTSGNSSTSGSGSASGFFTNNAAGSGMTYSMDANVGGTPTSVSGAAVFEQQ